MIVIEHKDTVTVITSPGVFEHVPVIGENDNTEIVFQSIFENTTHPVAECVCVCECARETERRSVRNEAGRGERTRQIQNIEREND